MISDTSIPALCIDLIADSLPLPGPFTYAFTFFKPASFATPAASSAANCAATAHAEGLRKVKVYVKGPGNGRESAIRSIHNAGIEVTEIIDVTPMPHNGCRPPKRRRV